MAKRKRLTPAQPDHFNPTGRAPETKSMTGPGFSAPPIAQVAGEAATLAALDEVTSVLQEARKQGRLIEALPLTAINAGYLVRDRLVQDDDEMAALIDSLRSRGQQTPIEVTALPVPVDGTTHGLISGWRRLTALNRLYQETKDPKFATIKALIIAPETAEDAYLAMVEENEIRVNLSLYERANIALRAAREGVFPTPRHAVLALFASTTRSKRSKIGTFITLVEALDTEVLHPTAIPEKLGLGLARALQEDAGLAASLRSQLKSNPSRSMTEEMQLLSGAISGFRPTPALVSTPPSTPTPILILSPEIAAVPAKPSDPVMAPAPATPPVQHGDVVPGVRVRFDRARQPRIELTGVAVNEALYRALKQWLAENGQK